MFITTINKNKLKKAIAQFLSIENWKEVNVDHYNVVFQTNVNTNFPGATVVTYSQCKNFHTNNMLENDFGFSCDINVFVQKYIWTIKSISKYE